MKFPLISDLRLRAEKIWTAGLAAVDPAALMRTSLVRNEDVLRIADREEDLAKIENVFLIAFGKAARAMAGAAAGALGGRLTAGLAVVLPGDGAAIAPRIEVFEAPHPLPDERSAEAARRALELAGRAGRRDLVLVLVSGGGSAMLALPRLPVSIADKRILAWDLMRAGADIQELNIVRKHLSLIKGGGLARAAQPARVAVLAISDVIGDDPGSIASGPAAADLSTFADAAAVLAKYGLWSAAPAAVREVLESGAAGRIPETMKPGDLALVNASTAIIGNNATALEAARCEAERRGFRTHILTISDRGEARDAAKSYAAQFARLAEDGRNPTRPFCLLAGGELTVRVAGGGRGGRNQEFVLAFLLELERLAGESAVLRSHGAAEDFRASGLWRGRDWLAFSLGTDGQDGPTDAAGAWASPAVWREAVRRGLRPDLALVDNDSHAFFKGAGGLVFTGPTGTNVMDIRAFFLA